MDFSRVSWNAFVLGLVTISPLVVFLAVYRGQIKKNTLGFLPLFVLLNTLVVILTTYFYSKEIDPNKYPYGKVVIGLSKFSLFEAITGVSIIGGIFLLIFLIAQRFTRNNMFFYS